MLSGGALYYFYQQNVKIQSSKNQTVKIYVTKKSLKQNQKIEEKDLAVLNLPKISVPFKVLIKNEIIGKYTLSPIFKNEPIRAEKIGKQIKSEDLNSTAAIEKAKYDLYNIALKLFDMITRQASRLISLGKDQSTLINMINSIKMNYYQNATANDLSCIETSNGSSKIVFQALASYETRFPAFGDDGNVSVSSTSAAYNENNTSDLDCSITLQRNL